MIVACVRTGDKYSTDYVYKLRDMVKRHLKMEHEFVCLTDRPKELLGVGVINISSYKLAGWWGKMYLFELFWRASEKVLYFDLDTVICGDITELAKLDIDLGICGNFTRAAGNLSWPCRYGSCCMVIGKNLSSYIWDVFCKNKNMMMASIGHYGDQKAIEEIYPSATILQEVLKPNFFVGYRNLTDKKPDDCSIVVFAGSHKPDNCEHDWIKKEWALS